MNTLNRTILEAALHGLEAQKQHTEAQIAQVQAMLPDATPESVPRKRRKFSAATRLKMKKAQQKRRAKIRGEAEPAKAPAKRRRRISKEGVRRIIAAAKKRWRLQKAMKKPAVAKTATAAAQTAAE